MRGTPGTFLTSAAPGRRSVPRRLPRYPLVLLEAGIGLGLVAVTAVVVAGWGGALLSWGGQRAYEADRQSLERAVAAFFASDAALAKTPSPGPGGTLPAARRTPTLGGQLGVPREGEMTGFQCDGTDPAEVCSWVSIGLLAEAGHLKGPAAIGSADTRYNTSATNAPRGSYGWYLGDNGQVASLPPFSPAVGYP